MPGVEGFRAKPIKKSYDASDVRWWEKAVCKDTDLELFFKANITREEDEKRKNLCNNCPVKKECLEEALRFEDPKTIVGFRAGLYAHERRKLLLRKKHS